MLFRAVMLASGTCVSAVTGANKPHAHEWEHFRKSVRPPRVKNNISGPFPIKFHSVPWHDKDSPLRLKHANQNMPHHRKYNLKNGTTIKNMSGTVKRIRIHIYIPWSPHTYSTFSCLFHSNTTCHPNWMGTNIVTL